MVHWGGQELRGTGNGERGTGRPGRHTTWHIGHERGFFVEARLGSGMAQRFKLGVGWAVELK